ncbi:glutathione ABC transporter substrate-binding protein [Halalkalibacillus halophilus]|uniref:glutathione ABC transporter substrate-binding protein n=1 Tax=Halalkalibacillus halophilus TaxID=392827 RepID=UPI00040FE078|nr:glutathione ABC transporter substrate-binding protein [Halalkalibacillus halophilus]
MRSKNLAWLLALFLVLAMFLAACAGDGEPEESEGSTDDSASEEEDSSSEDDEASGEEDDSSTEDDAASEGDGEENVVIAVPAELSSLSAHGSNDVPSGNVRSNIYETLITLDDEGNPQENLATNWEQLDETTWQFEIREGVTFHDGSDLNAEVVKMNFDRLLDEEIGSQGASIVSAIDTVEAVDEYTLEVTLQYAFSPILNHLAHNNTSIMSGEIIEADAEAVESGDEIDQYINSNPIGTGPFMFDTYTPGDQIVLARNDDYWGDVAEIETITFRTIPETSTRLAELETGAVHIADAIEPDNIDRVSEMDGTSVLQESSTSLNFIAFNTQVEPLNDERVRRAISLAIDQSQIIDGIYDGTSIPATGPIPPGVLGHDEDIEGLGYDLEEAQSLLEEAGYGDGFEISLKTNSDNPQRMNMATYAESALSELNITVNIEGMEFGAFIEDAAEGQTEMFILGWSTPTMDGDYSTHLLFHSDNHGMPGNMTFFDDPEVDEILDEARREADLDTRMELYSEASEMLIQKAPMVFVNHTEYLLGVSDSIEGFGVAPNGIYQFNDVTVE